MCILRFHLLVLVALFSCCAVLCVGADETSPPPLRVGFDPAWPPFSMLKDDGTAEGIDIDIIRLLAAHLDRDLELIPTASWQETWQQFLDKKIDLTLGTAQTPDRMAHASFTERYISFPVALITRVGGPFMIGLRALDQERIAAPVDHVTALYILDVYPTANMVLASSSEEALLMVARGEADLVLENLATASHIIRTRGLTTLKIAGIAEIEFTLRYAVQPDQPELLAALNQLLQADAHTSRLHTILDAWIPIDYQRAIQWQSVRKATIWMLSVLIPMMAVIVWWNRRLHRELNERRRVETALRKRTADLDAANARLCEGQREKDMIMKMAAHDLNNPLTTILLNAECLQDEEEHPDVRVTAILNGAERMNRMLRNLLHSDAIEHGVGWLTIQPVEAVPVVQRIVDRYLLLARQKDIGLSVKNHVPAGTQIMVDADALDQIVDNLLSNALKYTPSDRGIYVDMSVVDDCLRISLRDEGPGIAEDQRASLFTPYFRTRNQPTRGERSNGLGLAVVKHLMDKMNGRVWFEAGEEPGSTFIVEFPLSDPALAGC